MIAITEQENGWFVAEDTDAGHTWADRSAGAALLGLAVFNGVDEGLAAVLPVPQTIEQEEERNKLWHEISNATMARLRGARD